MSEFFRLESFFWWIVNCLSLSARLLLSFRELIRPVFDFQVRLLLGHLEILAVFENGQWWCRYRARNLLFSALLWMPVKRFYFLPEIPQCHSFLVCLLFRACLSGCLGFRLSASRSATEPSWGHYQTQSAFVSSSLYSRNQHEVSFSYTW